MNSRIRKLTLSDVSLATHYARQAREKAAKAALSMMVDPDRDQRIADGECATCFYLRRGGVVGHGFTEYTCSVCSGTFQHPNTGVPKVCEGCARKNELCRRCSADVHLRERRRAEPKAPRKRAT